MKKKFSIIFASMLAFFLFSCTTSNSTDNPTGDPIKDSEVVCQKIIRIIKSVKTLEDAKKAEVSSDSIKNIYREFYKAKGESEFEEFDNILKKQLWRSKEFKKALDDFENRVYEKEVFSAADVDIDVDVDADVDADADADDDYESDAILDEIERIYNKLAEKEDE